jgi:hypothetical protein
MTCQLMRVSVQGPELTDGPISQTILRDLSRLLDTEDAQGAAADLGRQRRLTKAGSFE